jgi:hypothetical protein
VIKAVREGLVKIVRMDVLRKFLQRREEKALEKEANKRLEFYSSEVLDYDHPDDKEYLNNLIDDFVGDVAKSDTEANETDRALSGQLILITTVLITANIVVMGNKDSLNSLSPTQKLLLMSGLFLLMFSLCLGIKYYDEVKKFHKSWADGRHKVLTEVADFKISTYGDLRKTLDKNINDPLDAHMDEKYLNFQIFALVIALALYLLLAGTFLFTNHTPKEERHHLRRHYYIQKHYIDLP